MTPVFTDGELLCSDEDWEKHLVAVSSFMVRSIAIFIIEGKLIGKLYTEISKYVLEA